MHEHQSHQKKEQEQQFDYCQKIIIIGDSGVGKSNILLRYSKGKFNENNIVTIGINYAFKVITVDGIRIKLQIWDTAGQDKYKTVTQSYYRKTNGAIIAFSIDSKDSFYSVRKQFVISERWLDQLTSTVKQSTPILLVGNKIDLEHLREVSSEEALEYSQNIGVPYLECSAKSGQLVKQVFEKLGTMIKQRNIDAKIRQDPETPRQTVQLGGFTKKMRTRCCQK